MVAVVLAISLLFCVPVTLISINIARRRQSSGLSLVKSDNIKIILAVTFSVAFLLRMYLAFTTEGYALDIGTFKSWGYTTNTAGYSGVYEASAFLDYPPGYLYVLSFLDAVREFFKIDIMSAFYTMMLRIPSIIADLVTAFIVYKIANKKQGESFSLFCSASYLFCPAIILNSAVWGQVDSFCTMLALVSIIFLQKNNYLVAGIVYGICSLCKPQMLMFAPIFLFYTVYKRAFKGLAIGLLSCLGSIILLSTPFINNFNYFWLIEKYSSTLASYPYYSVNAYNFWALLGLNWSPLPNSEILVSLLNWSVPVLVLALVGIFMKKCKNSVRIYGACAIITATMYMFSIKMHERYFMPTLLFLVLVYALTKDRRFMYCFSVFTVVHCVNVYFVMITPGYFPPGDSWYILLTSFVFTIAYGYMMYLFYLYMKLPKGKTFAKNVKGKSEKMKRIDTNLKGRKALSLKDIWVVGAICVFYGIFAFWNLGDNKTANTSWNPTVGEEVVIETNGEFTHINYIIGIAKGENSSSLVGSNFSIYVSDDNVNWSEYKNLAEDSFSYVYQWQSIDIQNSPKYIKIVAQDDVSVLNEIAVVNQTTNAVMPVSLVSGSGESLIDEQDSVPVYSGYENSTYFDEIYHARTAYEHILEITPYENTHPPLGKLIIAFFINIFGMNPFGWRFAGALFGVLMLPVLYFILRRFFNSRVLCGAGIFIFAFDFMHFTQTRIATIDTYSVFFMLLMYAAMIVFCQKDIINSSIKSLILPLLLSGVFMGLGIASKWTCAYAAVGLAVMFFMKLIVTGHKIYKDKDTFKKYKMKCIDICLWCIGLFVVIPFGIYFVSFMPIMLLPHNQSDMIGAFLRAQTHMFNYHSGLVSEHPFASPYYEWPLVVQNIWYYITHNHQGSGMVSTISALGNPVVWWGGFAALVFAVVKVIKTKNLALNFILIGFASVYLPWVLIPRETFIYHYFTAVPFIVTAIIYFFSTLQNKKTLALGAVKVDMSKIVAIGFCVFTFVMFLVFFPVISGAPTNLDYANVLELLPDWIFA